jgi:hypothetical protein
MIIIYLPVLYDMFAYLYNIFAFSFTIHLKVGFKQEACINFAYFEFRVRLISLIFLVQVL